MCWDENRDNNLEQLIDSASDVLGTGPGSNPVQRKKGNLTMWQNKRFIALQS